ncbi:PepSY domain-containing protein [Erythrobacter mangrovi]|uniref:PepSY domain-containing protein n=1 Tax=Erythrobacter mangrovi TaxID=2739433 RepID=A0A7D3Y033_9SPHN|nr:hypothetical protein [Erythrobacter mangrovi]QKG71492.1 hypothetical protein HQR01_09030 [Erythrobacter mangrovi]
MRLNRVLMSFAAVALVPTVAFAAVDGEQDQAPEAEAKKEKPKRICRQIRNTGFRTASRICKTQEQWDAQDRAINGEELDIKTGNFSGRTIGR